MKLRIIAALSVILLMASCGSNDLSTQQIPTDTTLTVQNNTSTKFVLKGVNGQYIVIGPDFSLMANQPDESKAEVFDMVDMGNGKTAFKALSSNKFVCADKDQKGLLVANRDNAGTWETFEMINVDPAKINLKSFMGKFVCLDLDKGGVKLIADRDGAKEWETFTMIRK